MQAADPDPTAAVGSPGEVFAAFLKLGMTAFGGPIAHLGYMRREFVERRGWLDEARFAQLLAVCQFLPGPASSQLGFAIGLLRAGGLGALAAFVAFTLPSAVLMLGFALLATQSALGIGAALLHGLKLVAVVVVAHGLLGMARQLTPDAPRVLIAAFAGALMLLAGQAWMQLLVIALGGVLGLGLCRKVLPANAAGLRLRFGRRAAMVFAGLYFAGLGLALLVPASATPTMPSVAGTFYQAGALVFGGGHVVLPLLQHGVVDTGWMNADTFLAGYGAAQAVPGPMFSLAAFLGAQLPSAWPPAVMAVVALLAMFLPGFLLLLAVLPFWAQLTRYRPAARAMAGINAAVVGLLAAAFYNPVWVEAMHAPTDIAIAAIGFALLAFGRIASLWVVLWCVAAAVAVHFSG